MNIPRNRKERMSVSDDMMKVLISLHEKKAMSELVLIWPDDPVIVDKDKITALVKKWRHRARRRFWDAPKDKSTVMASDAMKGTAVIYMNCVDDLIEALGLSRLLVSLGREGEIEQ